MNNINLVGSPLVPRRTPLYENGGQLRLRQAEQRQDSDPVLVSRSGEEWKPVSLADARACFAEGKAELELGLWRDAKRFVVFAGDGQVQNSEVETLQQRWNTNHLGDSRVLKQVGGRESEYVMHFAQVDASRASIDDRGQLVEPRTVTKSELHTATKWDYSRRVGRYPSAWTTKSWGC